MVQGEVLHSGVFHRFTPLFVVLGKSVRGSDPQSLFLTYG